MVLANHFANGKRVGGISKQVDTLTGKFAKPFLSFLAF